MKRCMLIMLLILLVGSYSALAADQSSKQVKLDLGTIRITEPTQSETENTVIIKDFSFSPPSSPCLWEQKSPGTIRIALGIP